MLEDDSSVDTASAVSEEVYKHRYNNDEITPFLALGDASDPNNTGTTKVAAAVEVAPKKISFRPINKDDTREEYDAEPVHRRMGTRNCQESDCPNKGGKCGLHGSLCITCKLKDCQRFIQAHTNGFCIKHNNNFGVSKVATKAALGGHPSGGTKYLNSKKKKRKKEKKRKYEDPFPAASKAPPLLGPTNQDIVLSMYDQEFKSIMHEHFRDIELSKAGVAESGREIFEGFRAELKESGGMFLEKSGDGFVEVDGKEALRKITRTVQDRTKTAHIWCDDVSGKSQEKNVQEGKRKSSDSNDLSLAPNKMQKLSYALEKGTENVQDRMKTAHIWRDGNGKSQEKNAQDGKRKSSDSNDQSLPASKKKQKRSHNNAIDENVVASRRKTRNSTESSTKTQHVPVGATRVEDPLTYIGNHIANLLVSEDGWANVNKKVNRLNYGQVIFKKGCDRKTAVEGKDKFTGYAAVAKWAHADGYYEKHVVGTEDGMEILTRVGIQDDPYSIFKDASIPGSEESQSEKEQQRGGEGRNNDIDDSIFKDESKNEQQRGVEGRNNDSDGENRIRKPADSGTSTQRTEGGSNENPIILLEPGAGDILPDSAPVQNPIIVLEPAGDTLSDSAPVHIRDDADDANENQIRSPIFSSGTMEYLDLFEGIQSSFEVATADNDQDSLAFYGYLLRYFGTKARKKDFSLGSDKNAITEAVKSFESTKEKKVKAKRENNPGLDVYKHLLTHIINECETKLPLD